MKTSPEQFVKSVVAFLGTKAGKSFVKEMGFVKEPNKLRNSVGKAGKRRYAIAPPKSPNAAFKGGNKGIVLPKGRNAGKRAKSGQKTAIKRGGKGVSRSIPARTPPYKGETGGKSNGKGKAGKRAIAVMKPDKKRSEFQWYVIAVTPGFNDKKTRTRIVRGKKKEGLSRYIRKVLSIRTETQKEVKGEIKTFRTARFPGYLLVECKLNDEVKSYLQTMKGVLCILMNRDNIVGVESQHAATLMLENQQVGENKKKELAARKKANSPASVREETKPNPTPKFEVGQTVRINRTNPTLAWHGSEVYITEVDDECLTAMFYLMGAKQYFRLPHSEFQHIKENNGHSVSSTGKQNSNPEDVQEKVS